MYINLKYLIFSLTLIFTVSCQKAKYTVETQEFNDYLQKVFYKKIPNEKSCFLLLPGLSCLGCTKHSAMAFKKNMTKPNYYVIVGILANGYISNYYETMLDTLGEIINLKFTKNQATIVHTQGGFIEKLYHINTNNLDSLDYYINN